MLDVHFSGRRGRGSSSSGGGGGASAIRTLTVGAGQSNIGNWSSGTFNSAGKNAFLATMDAFNAGVTNAFVNAGVGTSFVSKTAYLVDGAGPTTVNGVSTERYWVDDSDTNNLAAGPLALAALVTLTNAGYTASDVTHLIWDQGENEQTSLRTGTISNSQYIANLTFLFNYFQAQWTGIEKIFIIPIGKRSLENTGANNIRYCQRAMPAINNKVILAAEKYDQGLYDSLHVDEIGYSVVGRRTALALLASRGRYAGPSHGPQAGTPTISADQLIIPITQDITGLRLKNNAGTVYNGSTLDITPTATGFYKVYDAGGNDMGPDKVEITGGSQVTLTLGAVPGSDVTLYNGYAAFVGVEAASIPFDEHGFPMQSGIKTATYSAGSTPTGDWQVQEVTNTFGPSDTTVAQTITSTSTSLTSLHRLGSRLASVDEAGNVRDGFSTMTLASATSVSRTRGSTSLVAVNCLHKAAVVQWPSAMISSIQSGTITLTTTSTSGTATISSVDTSRSVVIFSGCSTSSNALNNLAHTLALTNATTVTATSDPNVTSSTRNVRFTVIEFASGIVSSKQAVSINIGNGESTHDQTITAVRRSRSMIFPAGWRKTAGTGTACDTSYGYLQLISPTTVRASRYNTSATDFLQLEGTVVEFTANHVAVQRGITSIANGSSTLATTVGNAPLTNSWINHLGFLNSSGSSGSESSYFGTLTLTNATTITGDRAGTSGVHAQSWELVSFL